MKKHLLLPFLFMALFFTSCTPDGEVDMPEPQKPISERILGVWESGSVYEFSENSYTLFPRGQYHNLVEEDYSIIEEDNKTFIKLKNGVGDYMTYEITSFTDSTMTWEMNENSSQPPYEEFHSKIEFRRRKVIGQWRTISTTKVTYDTDGSVLKEEQVDNKTKGFNIDAVSLLAYRNDQSGEADYADYYVKYTQNGGMTLTLYYLDIPEVVDVVEVTSITDNQMTWIQKESPSVSYIIELEKENQ